MKISFDKYPIDIILFMVWNTLMIPINLLKVEETIRIILGLPFILFIPGYLLIYALFPSKKTNRGIDTIERIVLSFGVSIVIVPLIGFVLNYIPGGIRLESILLSIFSLSICVGFVALYRWINANPKERFTISLDLSGIKSGHTFDKVMTIILAVIIIITVVSFIYVLASPKTGEKFTEFYILGLYGKATNYSRNLAIGQNATATIGIVNHEYRTLNYTIEIWLINQTAQENKTIYNHAWYMNTIDITLNHTPIDTESEWKPQWETNYTFNINKEGNYKIVFLLYITPTQITYNPITDYNASMEEKINNTFREIYIFVTVT